MMKKTRTPLPADDPVVVAATNVIAWVEGGQLRHCEHLAHHVAMLRRRIEDAVADAQPDQAEDVRAERRQMMLDTLHADLAEAPLTEPGRRMFFAEAVAKLDARLFPPADKVATADEEPADGDVDEAEADQLKRMSRRTLDAVVDYINATGKPVTKIEANLEGGPSGIPERITFSFFPKGDGEDHARPGDLVLPEGCNVAERVIQTGRGWIQIPNVSHWIGPNRYEIVCRKEEIEKG